MEAIGEVRGRSRLDEVLPRWDVSKRYALAIGAAPDVVFSAIERYDPGSSVVVRVLMALRGYGWRKTGPAGGRGLASSLVNFGFVPLGGRPGKEIVFGVAGRFWRPSGGLCGLAAEEFSAFEEDGFAKAAWNLSVSADAAGGTLLETETRVVCFGARAGRAFGIYWNTIELASGAIRMSMLRGIRRLALSTGGGA